MLFRTVYCSCTHYLLSGNGPSIPVDWGSEANPTRKWWVRTSIHAREAWGRKHLPIVQTEARRSSIIFQLSFPSMQDLRRLSIPFPVLGRYHAVQTVIMAVDSTWNNLNDRGPVSFVKTYVDVRVHVIILQCFRYYGGISIIIRAPYVTIAGQTAARVLRGIYCQEVFWVNTHDARWYAPYAFPPLTAETKLWHRDDSFRSNWLEMSWLTIALVPRVGWAFLSIMLCCDPAEGTI